MTITDHHLAVLTGSLQELLAAAFEIDGAMDGVTDQFDDEVSTLQAAIARASRVLNAIERNRNGGKA